MTLLRQRKSQAQSERWGLPLPELTDALGSNDIIYQSFNVVKGFNENGHEFFENTFQTLTVIT